MQRMSSFLYFCYFCCKFIACSNPQKKKKKTKAKNKTHGDHHKQGKENQLLGCYWAKENWQTYGTKCSFFMQSHGGTFSNETCRLSVTIPMPFLLFPA